MILRSIFFQTLKMFNVPRSQLEVIATHSQGSHGSVKPKIKTTYVTQPNLRERSDLQGVLLWVERNNMYLLCGLVQTLFSLFLLFIFFFKLFFQSVVKIVLVIYYVSTTTSKIYFSKSNLQLELLNRGKTTKFKLSEQ